MKTKMTITYWSFFLSALFCFSGCSDYQINDVNKAIDGTPEAEEEPSAEEVTSEEVYEETSTEDEFTEAENEEVEEDDCTEEITIYDSEDISFLQDAVGYPYMRDAIIFDYEIPDETLRWRVSSVEILVMVPIEQFNFFTDGQTISVEIFDSNNPLIGDSWTLTLPVHKDQLTWQQYTLPYDAATAGAYGQFEQMGAWMPFDFSHTIPAEGMNNATFMVGVRWNGSGMPAVGYSNFIQSCDRNWTDYGDGNWVLNSVNTAASQCSWPMFHIQIEQLLNEDC